MRTLFCTLLLLIGRCGDAAAAQPIKDTAFIDHFNLRKMANFSQQQLEAQVVEIKTSLDKAKQYDVDTYILFSRSFEYLIDYDFSVDGLGDLSGRVYPADDQHRVTQQMYAQLLDEVLDYADKLGIKVVFHTNQFEFPDAVYEMAGDRISGGDSARICPAKPLIYDLLKGKINEFFRRFPKCSGLQLTLSETQAKIRDCKCRLCSDMSEADRFIAVADAALRACKANDKVLMLRTWGKYEKPEIVDSLPGEIVCSTKFTLPDFHLTNYPNPVMGRDAERQEVEFDGWGEYSGYNQFPCYYGDLFAPRIKECADKGVASVAIRLNWEPGVEYLFGKPYGNEANIYVFSKLARNPDGDPDVYLREYIARVYPQSAHDAAFKLYKRSTALQSTWLIWIGQNTNDHSRIYNAGFNRVMSQIGIHMPTHDLATVRREMHERRKQITECYEEAKQLVADLGPDVSDEWKRDMLRGARTSWYVAQGNCDCIELLAVDCHSNCHKHFPDIKGLDKRIRNTSAFWMKADPEMYTVMNGNCVEKMLDTTLERWGHLPPVQRSGED